MKKIVTILSLVFMSSTVFAGGFDSFKCGVQVGKSMQSLSATTVAQEMINLEIDLSQYNSQELVLREIQRKMNKNTDQTDQKALLKLRKERDQISQAQQNSWQGIMYAIEQIKAVSAETADSIIEACKLPLPVG